MKPILILAQFEIGEKVFHKYLKGAFSIIQIGTKDIQGNNPIYYLRNGEVVTEANKFEIEKWNDELHLKYEEIFYDK